MARRERPPDSEPPPRDRDVGEARRRLESVIPDLIKKAVIGGYDRASGARETINSFIADSKLPKEIATAIFAQIDDTKNGLFRVVAKEIRGFLEAVDFQHELQKLLTTVSFEIKTEIRFIPNDSAPDKLGRPEVKSDMKMKRADRDRDRDGKKSRRERRAMEREQEPRPEPPAPEPEETPPPPRVEDDDDVDDPLDR